MSLPTFQLVPTATNATAPFCFGHGFKKGDVPAGSSVTAPFSDFQCTAKNAWPDGSLKFAILAGRASVTGTTPLISQLSVGAAATGTAVAASSISAVATIDCGTFGAVTWSGADWASPFQTWISGPKMSSFIYRKPVGSDAHLVAWLEVRVWAGGEMEVLPWIENGYFRVAAPTNKSATYSFTLGGTQRVSVAIDLKHHQRTPLINGSALSYWLGADPGLTPLPSAAYLQASELVPTYSATVAAGAGRVPAQPATYAPLQQGSFNYDQDSMPSSGYQTPIGLLPEHDVLYLTCDPSDRVAMYNSVVRNGYSAGRYGIHFRDETTAQFNPPAFTTYPTLVLYNSDAYGFKDAGASTTGTYVPVPTGGNGPVWDTAHSPSVGYMAYMLTGRFYFMEETQFAATANHFNVTDWARGGGLGSDTQYNPWPTYTAASGLWTGTVQTRTGAWGFRALTQALSATPDTGNALRNELKTSVEENCRFFHQIYVAQPNNPQGIVKGPGGYTDLVSDRLLEPIWQQDFGTMAWGAALCLDLPISSTAATKMAAFFQWKAKSVITRMGDSTTWPVEQAGVYEYAVSPIYNPDFMGGTGPWYSSIAAAYAATRVDYQNVAVTPGTLYFDEGRFAVPNISIWAQLYAAFAYVVRHAVPGATAAKARFTSASNYSRYAETMATRPVWSVVESGSTSIQSGGSTVAGTPGPHAAFTNQLPRGAGRGVFGKRHTKGAPISDIPTGGTNGVSALRAIIENTDDPAIELRIHYTSKPTGFTSDGLGGYTYSGSLPATVSYDIYRGGEPASIGSATDTITSSGGSAVSSVVVSPSTATGSTTFAAVVNGTGSPSQAVTWTRSGTAGSINASTGAFTAPSPTGSIQTITITATSVLDGTKSGTATVTIAATVGSTVTGVAVSPASIGVVVGSSQQFTASVAGTLSPSQAVTWTVSGAASISTGGLATGPVGVYTVTATSQQNSAKAGTALFAVLAPGSASLAPDIGLNTLIVQSEVGIAPFIG